MEAAGADPYLLIQNEIDQELQQITTLQAKLFSGHGEVADSLRSRLQAAEDQLQALEAAVSSMVAEPSKFGLSAAAAFGRQVRDSTQRGHSCEQLLQQSLTAL
jgi:hypothetical protein